MVRATVKADTEGLGRQFKGPSQRTPEICHSQSELGGGHRQYQHQTHRVPSGQKAETVLCRRCPEPRVCRDQAGDSGTLAVRGEIVSHPLQPSEFFWLQVTETTIQTYSSQTKEEEEEQRGRREGGVAHSTEKSRIWVRFGTQMTSLYDSVLLSSLLGSYFLRVGSTLTGLFPLHRSKTLRMLLYSFQPPE